MILNASLVLTVGLVSAAAFGDAAPMSGSAVSTREGLVSERVVLRRGETNLEFHLGATKHAPSMTVWYDRTPSCQGFGVAKVEVLSGDEWVAAPSMNYSENLFFRTQDIEFNAIRMTIIQDQRMRMRCNIYVVGEEIELPELVTMLAKVSYVDCGEEETMESCTIQLQRIDEPTAAPFNAEKRSATRFKLAKGNIYKISGYSEKSTEEVTEFHLNSAELILP